MDKRIDQRIRKPRRAKGTPFYIHRNYYALGVLGFGALSWVLYELWPQSGILKKSLYAGKFEHSEEFKLRMEHTRASLEDPALAKVLGSLRERQGK